MGTSKSTLGAAYDLVQAGVHGLVGGAMAEAQGGEFLSGFVSSGIGAIAGSIVSSSPLKGMEGGLGKSIRSGLAGKVMAIANAYGPRQ
jgi:hypothetical protein